MIRQKPVRRKQPAAGEQKPVATLKPATRRKPPKPARPGEVQYVRMTVSLPVVEAQAFAACTFVCISATEWRAANRALAQVKAIARAAVDGR